MRKRLMVVLGTVLVVGALLSPPALAVDPTLKQVDVEDLAASGITQGYGTAVSKNFVFAVGYGGQVASYERGKHGKTKPTDDLALPSGFVNTLAVSPNGRTVYITAREHLFVVGVSKDGDLRLLKDLSAAGGTSFGNVYGVAVSDDGRFVYVADNATNLLTVFKRSKKKGTLTFASAKDGFQNPFLVALSVDDKQVYVTQNAGLDNGLVVLKRNGSSGAVSGLTELPFGTATSFPAFGIGAGKKTVVVSSILDPVVQSYTRSASGVLTPADVVEPADLDQLGYLARPGGGSTFYLESRGTHEISRWSVAANGDLTPKATTTSPDVLTPNGLCADGRNVYVTDTDRDTLVAFERTG